MRLVFFFFQAEDGIRGLLSEILQDEGYTVALAENAEVARQLRNQTRPALVLLDIWMPDCDGVTLLKEWAKSGLLNMPVVMMSGHASIDTAVEATRIGAFDFLEKPIALQKLLTTVQRALKYGDMQANTSLNLDKLGRSEPIQELKRQLERVAKVKSPVLLTGEPGSGFELVGRFFHQGNTPWVTPAKQEQLADAPLERW
ncbi:sigma-54-dependent Fis family transcriptional regulator, partial [Pseudomonas sp. MWU13-2860]